MNGDISLYIHIPFCTYKCPYCHFYVVADKEALKDVLLQALLKELDVYKSHLLGRNIVSVYFGGGTPTLFGAKRIQTLLSKIQPPSDCEITIEANPETITHDLMQDYLRAGINRVSIGVQSFTDSELALLGRRHEASYATESIHTCYDVGFRNISIDLMYEVPNQTLESWEKSLALVGTLPVTHLSLYNLTIEPYTPFARKESELRALMPDNETGTKMYRSAIEKLSAIGLRQYEISAFCKDELYSRHNIGYWTGREFLGLGPSAFSFYQDKRFSNIANLTRYAKLLEDGKSPIDFTEEISKEKRLRERLVLQLRLRDGADMHNFSHLDAETEKSIESLIAQGLLKRSGDMLSLSEKGCLFYDHIASELI